MDQQSGLEFTRRFSWSDLLCSVYFLNEADMIYEQAIKLLLSELVGQCRNILIMSKSAHMCNRVHTTQTRVHTSHIPIQTSQIRAHTNHHKRN